VQNVKKMLHHVIISSEPKSWDTKLPNLLWALHSIKNDTTGISPYQRVYGKPGRGPLEVMRDTWTGDTEDTLILNKTST